MDRANLPQIRAALEDESLRDLAETFGAPVIVNASMRDGSLRACAAANGIPVMVYEAGEALRFDELSIRAGIRGVLQVMRKLGMLPPARKQRTIRTMTASSTTWARAVSSGIVTYKVELGSRVRENDRLALMGDALGNSDAVEAFAAVHDMALRRTVEPNLLET